MREMLEVLRILLSLSFLALSSWYDFKTREVSNRVWMLFAPSGFALSLLQYYLNRSTGASSFLLFWLLSFLVTTGVSLALFYLGFFGGADAKALICLSIVMPVYPSLAQHHPNLLTPLFPLAVLGNAALVTSLLAVVIALYNLCHLIHTREKMFEGLEKEPLWSKMLAFTIGHRVDLSKIRDGSHYIPLEYCMKGENGETVRHLRISPRLDEESSPNNVSPNLPGGLHGKIWATPGVPFMISITIGFVAAILFGDFITWLVVRLIAGQAA